MLDIFGVVMVQKQQSIINMLINKSSLFNFHCNFAVIFTLCITILFASPQILFSREKPVIAILDLEVSSGVSPELKASFSDQLFLEILRTNNYSLVDRGKIRKIFEDEKEGIPNLASTDSISRFGRKLGADKVITGEVRKIGEIFYLTLQMIDIQTARVESTASFNCQCDIAGLVESVKYLGLKLLGQPIEDELRRLRSFPGEGWGAVEIKSDPKGASVYLDGRVLDGVTPLRAEKISSGEHSILLVKGGFSGGGRAVIRPHEVFRAEYSLTKQKGTLEVSSEPQEADFFLDGSYQGKTPVVINDIFAGKHELRITKKWFLDYEGEIEVKPRDTARISPKLVQVGGIYVDAGAKGAEVEIDGEMKGLSPIEIEDITPGPHRLKLSKYGYRTAEEEIQVEPGKITRRENIKLEIITGNLSLKSRPAGAAVLINGIKVGVTPLGSAPVQIGEHELIIQYPGFQEFSRKLSIEEGREYPVEVTLTALPQSKVVEVRFEKRTEGMGRRGIYTLSFLGAGIASLAGSLALYYEANSRSQDYDSIVADYKRYVNSPAHLDPASIAEFEKKAKSAKDDYSLNRNLFYAMLGTGALCVGASIYLFFRNPPEEKTRKQEEKDKSALEVKPWFRLGADNAFYLLGEKRF